MPLPRTACFRYFASATHEARPDLDLKIAYYHEDQNSHQGAPGSGFNAGLCSNALYRNAVVDSMQSS